MRDWSPSGENGRKRRTLNDVGPKRHRYSSNRQNNGEQAEQQKQQAEASRARAEQVKAEAEQSRIQAQQAQAEALAQRQAAQADAERARQAAQQAEQEKEETRARLMQQLNQVLQTRESARGLIVSIPDVLFDIDRYTLSGEAREQLAKVAGILLAHPGLTAVSNTIKGSQNSERKRFETSWLAREWRRIVLQRKASAKTASYLKRHCGWTPNEPSCRVGGEREVDRKSRH